MMIDGQFPLAVLFLWLRQSEPQPAAVSDPSKNAFLTEVFEIGLMAGKRLPQARGSSA